MCAEPWRERGEEMAARRVISALSLLLPLAVRARHTMRMSRYIVAAGVSIGIRRLGNEASKADCRVVKSNKNEGVAGFKQFKRGPATSRETASHGIETIRWSCEACNGHDARRCDSFREVRRSCCLAGYRRGCDLSGVDDTDERL